MSDNNSTSGGVGVIGLLGVAFVVLKLTGMINWPWWWVTCPFWGPVVLILLLASLKVFLYDAIKENIARKELDKRMKEINKPRKSKFEQRLEEAMEKAKEAKKVRR